MAADQPDNPGGSRCAACGAGLAHDQRYCVECGARCGPLPAGAADAIAKIAERGEPATVGRGPASAPTVADAASEPVPLPGWLRTPRAAAAAVLAMLGFGVVVGSTVGPGIASVLPQRSLDVVLGGFSRPVTQLTSSGGGGGSGRGGGSGNRPSNTTTTTTTPAPPATSTTPTTTTPTTGNRGLPPIKHVFLIVLSDAGYSQTFGSANRYFARTLAKQGELFPNYYAVTGGELANEIALVSGQGPTPQTATNCATFANFKSSGKGKFGQLLGSGCVYPSQTETIASQLSASKYGGWKAYIEGMNDAGSGRERTCNHPPLGAADGHPSPTAADPYVTWTNPFVYFHGLLGSACKQDDVPLTRLATDLNQTATTPALSYIAPSPCDDGNAQPCRPGAAAGLAPAETFLKTIVPEIERSAAYKADGMIAITFAQAPQSGPSQDTTGCAACDPQTYPNLRAGTTTTPSATTTTSSTTTTPTTTTTTPTTTTTTPTTTTTTTTMAATPTGPSGGGQVGLLVISKYMKAGSVDVTDDFDHYSLLASIEKLFGLKTLGYAHDIALPVFSATTYNAGLP